MALIAAAGTAAAAAGIAAGGVVGAVLAPCALAGLLGLAGRFLHLDVLLADWRFAIDVARGRHAAHAARITRFADEIAAALGRPGVDEVLLVGHSLGTVFAVEALAEALRRDPGLLRAGPRFALVGLGSSVLKIALHLAVGGCARRWRGSPPPRGSSGWTTRPAATSSPSSGRSRSPRPACPGTGRGWNACIPATWWTRPPGRASATGRCASTGSTCSATRGATSSISACCCAARCRSRPASGRTACSGPDGALGAGGAAYREASAPVPEPAA